MDITQDLYGLLGVEATASISEIKEAYHKKGLSCHPDKNPDNPRAVELFQELSKAVEILMDETARAAYDQAIAARKQAKERVRKFDAKRKRFKADLEAHEEADKRLVDPTPVVDRHVVAGLFADGRVRRPRGRAAEIRRQEIRFMRFLYQLSNAHYYWGRRGGYRRN